MRMYCNTLFIAIKGVAWVWLEPWVGRNVPCQGAATWSRTRRITRFTEETSKPSWGQMGWFLNWSIAPNTLTLLGWFLMVYFSLWVRTPVQIHKRLANDYIEMEFGILGFFVTKRHQQRHHQSALVKQLLALGRSHVCNLRQGGPLWKKKHDPKSQQLALHCV